jgi:hypothetical protein
MTFSCHICHKEFKTRWHLTRHLEKKNKCIAPNNSNNITNTSASPICQYCDKSFTYKSSLSRHITQLRCDKIPDNVKKHILEENENKKIKEINYKNNVLIHKHILPFGKEDYDVFLKESDILEILNKSTQNISFFLTKTHYDIIQHRNFFMPNRRNTKHIKVFNGKICIYLKNEDFKKRLVKYTMKLLKEWFFKYCDKIENNKKTLLMSCFNKYKNKNKTYIQNLYENIETFLLTYSASIKSIILKRIKEEKSSDNKITILNRLLENI